MKKLTFVIAVALFAAAPALFAQAQDTVTIGSGTVAAGSTIDIPIYVRDVSGTPLGIDQPPGSRIQSYSIKVNYSPAPAVQSISIARAGITASLTPLFEATPASAGSITLIDTFEESTNLIPFTSNKPAPGDQIAVVHITAGNVAHPTNVALTIDSTLTQLSNQAGTTSETAALATLALVNGNVNVYPIIPALSTIALLLLAAVLAFVAVKMH